MQLPIPKEINVSLDSDGFGIRFDSFDEMAVIALASNYSRRRGLRNVGSCRTTTCNITPEPGNQEHNLGVPSAHFMFLVSHVNLEFAGDREPQTTTVYRTLTFKAGSEEPQWLYHFTAEFK
jgi:hypothetical protein